MKRQSTVDERAMDTASFIEFLALPESDVIVSDSQPGHERTSTDPILGKRSPPALEFPWPVKLGNRDNRYRKRQTIHGNWALRGSTTDDSRPRVRPLSEPMSPRVYNDVGKPV